MTELLVKNAIEHWKGMLFYSLCLCATAEVATTGIDVVSKRRDFESELVQIDEVKDDCTKGRKTLIEQTKGTIFDVH